MLNLGDAECDYSIEGPETLVINNKSDSKLILKKLNFQNWRKTKNLETEVLSTLDYIPYCVETIKVNKSQTYYGSVGTIY